MARRSQNKTLLRTVFELLVESESSLAIGAMLVTR
jgi:hypothetical protein